MHLYENACTSNQEGGQNGISAAEVVADCYHCKETWQILKRDHN